MTQKDSYFIIVCHYLTYLLDYMKNIEEYKEEKKTTRIMWFNFTAYVHIEKPPLMAISSLYSQLCVSMNPKKGIYRDYEFKIRYT